MTRGLSSFWDELVSVGDDLGSLFALITRRVTEVVGEASVLTTVSEDGQWLEPGAVFHPDPDVRAFMRAVLASEPYPVGEGVAGAVAARRESAVVSGFHPGQLDQTSPHSLRFVERYPIRSLAIVPMVAFGEVVGTLGAVRIESEQPYTDEDVMVLEALAERAALALADAKGRPRRLDATDYEAIFRQNVDGVLFTAPDGRVLAANPAACDILQRTEWEICRAGRAGVMVDDEASRAAVAQRALQGHVRAEVQMRRGSGEEFTADLSSTIFTTADGEVRASVIFRDITSSVRARDRLARQHRDLTLLHRVTDAINDAADLDAAIQQTLDLVGQAAGWPLGDAFLLSDDGILQPSPARRIADPERLGWFRDRQEPTTPTAVGQLAGRVVDTRSGVWESELPTTDPFPGGGAAPGLRSYLGVPIMVGASVRGVLELFSDEPMPRDDGLLTVLVDLGTQLGRALERTEAEAAHRRLDEERAAFVARAAHELRTPVAALVLAVGVLAGRDAGDETSRELIDVVVDSTEHLDRLVDRLLDLSRIEHGTTRIALEEVDVSRAVARALAVDPPADGYTVSCEVPADVRAVADRLALGQVVTNLLTNAYRYGGDHVVVSARRVGETVELSVADDGPGVDPALDATLFAPFARGGGGGEGVGLGLAISSRLADAMGGSLRHERPEGGGCRFVVTLPASRPLDAHATDGA
jgi:PAS domain S-box-containing protein